MSQAIQMIEQDFPYEGVLRAIINNFKDDIPPHVVPLSVKSAREAAFVFYRKDGERVASITLDDDWIDFCVLEDNLNWNHWDAYLPDPNGYKESIAEFVTKLSRFS